MAFDIKTIATLARLSLKPEEEQKLQKDLESILAYVEKLKSLDTGKAEATSHVLDVENVFRPDEVKPCEIREETLEHAPLREGKFFKVPKVVDKE